jgi:apolipoprotein N-acyltransferase
MVQLAEVVGERGVAFVMALSAGMLAAAGLAGRDGLWRPAAARLAVAVGIPLVTFALGRRRIREVEAARREAPTARIALVDPRVDPHDRWNPDSAAGILAGLTRTTALAEGEEHAELTVWPEASYPYPIAHATRRCPTGPFAILPYGVRGPVLAGLVMTGANGDLHNSAAVCLTSGVLEEPQDKMHLLWFGETIPWVDRIPWVRAKFTRGIGLVAGDAVVLQRAGRVRAAVLNCFEDTLPDAGREAMAARPNLLVNITNDAWFAATAAESELHLRLAVLRAVESRRDLVRAVNEGVTSWVDAAGVVRKRSSEPGGPPLAHLVIAEAALMETGPTTFDRFGDVPLAILLAASVVRAIQRAQKRAS